MARKKKLPLIEDFDNIPEEALVPEDEQPYEIPDHWKWVRLGAVATVVKDKTEEFSFGTNYVGLEHLSSGGGLSHVGDAYGLKSAKTVFSDGDVLYGRLRPYLNKHWIAERSGVCSTDILVFRSQPVIDVVWFDAWLGTDFFVSMASSNTRGINLPRVSEPFLVSVPVPLPPLSEQDRIVEKLEARLTQIDQAIERTEDVLVATDQQMASLVRAAVSGRLTMEWRENHKISREQWTSTTLGQAFKWSSGGTPSRRNPQNFIGDIPWLKSGELRNEPVNNSEEHINLEALDSSNAKVFPAGSVLIAMYGATIGQVGLLEIDAATNQAIAVARESRHSLSEYLFYYLIAHRDNFIALGKGGAQLNISQRVIKAYKYEIPPIDEQREILRLIRRYSENFETVVDLVTQTRNLLACFRSILLRAALAGRLK